MSGLQEAHDLIASGSVTSTYDEIVVLEAMDCIGGRVKQDNTFLPDGATLELGAEFIHGSHGSRLHDLAKSEGIVREPVYCWTKPNPSPVHGSYGLYLLPNNRLVRCDTEDDGFWGLIALMAAMGEALVIHIFSIYKMLALMRV